MRQRVRRPRRLPGRMGLRGHGARSAGDRHRPSNRPRFACFAPVRTVLELEMSEMMLTPGQFLELRGNLWQFVRKTNDGLYELYNHALNKHEPFHKAQLAAWWE